MPRGDLRIIGGNDPRLAQTSPLEFPQRILLIRPSALGDVCRSVPLLVSLRARWPEASIDWLVRDRFGDAVAHHPDLTAVVPFPRERVDLSRWWRASARADMAGFVRSLRGPGYGLVIDAQGLWRSGFFAWVTGAPRRVGFADARELGWLGLTQRVPPGASPHTVDRMLTLVEAAGAPPIADMRLYAAPGDIEWARGALGEADGAAGIVLLAPTSIWPGKRWPADRFAMVAAELLRLGAAGKVVIVGGPGERGQCGPLLELAARDRRVVDLVGRTSVGQLMALVRASALVIANDSAAVHMAVGFDRPLVALYGPTQIELVGPYRREADVIQASAPGGAEGNLHKSDGVGIAAMRAIEPERVLAAALERLSGAPVVAS